MPMAELPAVAPDYAVGWPFGRDELAVRIARVNAMGAPAAPKAGGKYAAYLSSPSWRHKRLLVLALANCVCFDCKGRATEVHHRTYVRIGREKFEDLEPVCEVCHARSHDRIRPGTTQSIADCMSEAFRTGVRQ